MPTATVRLFSGSAAPAAPDSATGGPAAGLVPGRSPAAGRGDASPTGRSGGLAQAVIDRVTAATDELVAVDGAADVGAKDGVKDGAKDGALGGSARGA